MSTVYLEQIGSWEESSDLGYLDKCARYGRLRQAADDPASKWMSGPMRPAC